MADPAVVQVVADAEAGRRREFCPEVEAVEVAAGGGRRKHSCKKMADQKSLSVDSTTDLLTGHGKTLLPGKLKFPRSASSSNGKRLASTRHIEERVCTSPSI